MAKRKIEEIGNSSSSPPPGKQRRHMACESCRKRKLKCCGSKPTCKNCEKRKNECNYSESFRKSGPKRGYISNLEKRLHSMEKLLIEHGISYGYNLIDPSEIALNPLEGFEGDCMQTFDFTSLLPLNVDESYPDQSLTIELIDTFFESSVILFDFINKSKVYTALSGGIATRPKPYFFYSLLTVSASMSEKHHHLQEEFYRRAVKYIERTERAGFGESVVCLQYVQSLILLAIYEHTAGSFARGYLFTSKAIGAAFMSNLNEIDSPYPTRLAGLFGQSAISNHNFNKLDKQEGRFAIWILFVLDRIGSIASGWPVFLDENQISTWIPLDSIDSCGDDQTSWAAYSDLFNNPKQYMPNRPSYLACIIAHSTFFSEAFLLLKNIAKSFEPATTKSWWTKYNDILKSILQFADAFPSLESMKSSGFNSKAEISEYDSLVSLLVVHYTCLLSLYRAGSVKCKFSGSLSKSLDYEKKSFQASVDAIMALRKANNLFNIAAHPYALYCIYTAARSFLLAVKNQSVIFNNLNSSTAEINSSIKIITQCKGYIDFILTVFKVVQSRVKLAECFFKQISIDIESVMAVSGIKDLTKHDIWKGRSTASGSNSSSKSSEPTFIEKAESILMKPTAEANPFIDDLTLDETTSEHISNSPATFSSSTSVSASVDADISSSSTKIPSFTSPSTVISSGNAPSSSPSLSSLTFPSSHPASLSSESSTPSIQSSISSSTPNVGNISVNPVSFSEIESNSVPPVIPLNIDSSMSSSKTHPSPALDIAGIAPSSDKTHASNDINLFSSSSTTNFSVQSSFPSIASLLSPQSSNAALPNATTSNQNTLSNSTGESSSPSFMQNPEKVFQGTVHAPLRQIDRDVSPIIFSNNNEIFSSDPNKYPEYLDWNSGLSTLNIDTLIKELESVPENFSLSPDSQI